MKCYKLERDITLYKSQFEDCIYNIFQEHKMERLSIDTDSTLFKIKYMLKHNKDIDKLNIIKNEFINNALQLRNTFNEFVIHLLHNFVGFNDTYDMNDIIDVLAQDVKIDSVYIKFKMLLISNNKDYLNYVDNTIPSDTFNIYPDKFFRFFTDSYNDGIAKAYPELFENKYQSVIGSGNDSDVFTHTFTFQTSEACNLCCTYCYQENKTDMRMNFDTAKKFIDNLLDNKYGYINQYNSPAIILEFIGGEPLLEIELTRKIYEYFLDKTYDMNHPWFKLHRVSICSNGLLYFDPNVQSFFKDYSQNISFNISIDGNKELHDSCRIQPNGEGSYDIDMMALNHYAKNYSPERNSKMTLAPSNIMYLFDSVVDFINKGMLSININCIFEEGWNKETALIEYNELKKLADYILENDLEHIYIAIFNEMQEDVHDKNHDGPFCGGTGSMLSLRPNGQFYPCIRYMPTSVGNNVQDLCIGTVEDGLVGRDEDSEIIKMLDGVTRRLSSNDICYNCPISNDCGECSALGHTLFGTPNKRATFICIQMIAEALANVYYWNLLNIKHPEYNLGVRKNNVPKEWSLKVINEEELDYLEKIEIMSMIKVIEYQSNA